MRILIVDDDSHIRGLVADVLSGEGEVTRAADGPTALAILLAGEPFDCVILDVMMPGASGLEVLEIIRTDHLLFEVAVVMLTAKANDLDHFDGFRYGADAYVTKPFDVHELIDTVREVVSLPTAQRIKHRRSKRDRAEVLARVSLGLTLSPSMHHGGSTW